MKRKGVPWLPYALTLLCIFTAASLSLSSATIAKYIASASVSTSPRVATWDVKTATQSTSPIAGTVFYTDDGGGGGKSQANSGGGGGSSYVAAAFVGRGRHTSAPAIPAFGTVNLVYLGEVTGTVW